MTDKTGQQVPYQELWKRLKQVTGERNRLEAKLAAPPCACGGKTPLAEVEVFVEKDEIQHLIAGASQIYFGLETTPRPNEIPVRILVFDLPGGKP